MRYNSGTDRQIKDKHRQIVSWIYRHYEFGKGVNRIPDSISNEIKHDDASGEAYENLRTGHRISGVVSELNKETLNKHFPSTITACRNHARLMFIKSLAQNANKTHDLEQISNQINNLWGEDTYKDQCISLKITKTKHSKNLEKALRSIIDSQKINQECKNGFVVTIANLITGNLKETLDRLEATEDETALEQSTTTPQPDMMLKSLSSLLIDYIDHEIIAPPQSEETEARGANQAKIQEIRDTLNTNHENIFGHRSEQEELTTTFKISPNTTKAVEDLEHKIRSLEKDNPDQYKYHLPTLNEFIQKLSDITQEEEYTFTEWNDKLIELQSISDETYGIITSAERINDIIKVDDDTKNSINMALQLKLMLTIEEDQLEEDQFVESLNVHSTEMNQEWTKGKLRRFKQKLESTEGISKSSSKFREHKEKAIAGIDEILQPKKENKFKPTDQHELFYPIARSAIELANKDLKDNYKKSRGYHLASLMLNSLEPHTQDISECWRHDRKGPRATEILTINSISSSTKKVINELSEQIATLESMGDEHKILITQLKVIQYKLVELTKINEDGLDLQERDSLASILEELNDPKPITLPTELEECVESAIAEQEKANLASQGQNTVTNSVIIKLSIKIATLKEERKEARERQQMSEEDPTIRTVIKGEEYENNTLITQLELINTKLEAFTKRNDDGLDLQERTSLVSYLKKLLKPELFSLPDDLKECVESAIAEEKTTDMISSRLDLMAIQVFALLTATNKEWGGDRQLEHSAQPFRVGKQFIPVKTTVENRAITTILDHEGFIIDFKNQRTPTSYGDVRPTNQHRKNQEASDLKAQNKPYNDRRNEVSLDANQARCTNLPGLISAQLTGRDETEEEHAVHHVNDSEEEAELERFKGYIWAAFHSLINDISTCKGNPRQIKMYFNKLRKLRPIPVDNFNSIIQEFETSEIKRAINIIIDNNKLSDSLASGRLFLDEVTTSHLKDALTAAAEAAAKVDVEAEAAATAADETELFKVLIKNLAGNAKLTHNEIILLAENCIRSEYVNVDFLTDQLCKYIQNNSDNPAYITDLTDILVRICEIEERSDPTQLTKITAALQDSILRKISRESKSTDQREISITPDNCTINFTALAASPSNHDSRKLNMSKFDQLTLLNAELLKVDNQLRTELQAANMRLLSQLQPNVAGSGLGSQFDSQHSDKNRDSLQSNESVIIGSSDNGSDPGSGNSGDSQVRRSSSTLESSNSGSNHGRARSDVSPPGRPSSSTVIKRSIVGCAVVAIAAVSILAGLGSIPFVPGMIVVAVFTFILLGGIAISMFKRRAEAPTQTNPPVEESGEQEEKEEEEEALDAEAAVRTQVAAAAGAPAPAPAEASAPAPKPAAAQTDPAARKPAQTDPAAGAQAQAAERAEAPATSVEQATEPAPAPAAAAAQAPAEAGEPAAAQAAKKATGVATALEATKPNLVEAESVIDRINDNPNSYSSKVKKIFQRSNEESEYERSYWIAKDNEGNSALFQGMAGSTKSKKPSSVNLGKYKTLGTGNSATVRKVFKIADQKVGQKDWTYRGDAEVEEYVYRSIKPPKEQVDIESNQLEQTPDFETKKEKIQQLVSDNILPDSYHIPESGALFEPFHGITLDKAINKKSINPTQVSLSLLKEVAELHKKRYFHRDIKPANICVKNNRVKLIDFQDAMEISDCDKEEKRRETDGITPAYSKQHLDPDDYDPEKLHSKRFCTRHDLFSTILVLHEICEEKTSEILNKAWNVLEPRMTIKDNPISDINIDELTREDKDEELFNFADLISRHYNDENNLMEDICKAISNAIKKTCPTQNSTAGSEAGAAAAAEAAAGLEAAAAAEVAAEEKAAAQAAAQVAAEEEEEEGVKQEEEEQEEEAEQTSARAEDKPAAKDKAGAEAVEQMEERKEEEEEKALDAKAAAEARAEDKADADAEPPIQEINDLIRTFNWGTSYNLEGNKKTDKDIAGSILELIKSEDSYNKLIHFTRASEHLSRKDEAATITHLCKFLSDNSDYKLEDIEAKLKNIKNKTASHRRTHKTGYSFPSFFTKRRSSKEKSGGNSNPASNTSPPPALQASCNSRYQAPE